MGKFSLELKKPSIVPSHKNVSKLLKMCFLFLFYQFVVRYFNSYFLMVPLTFFLQNDLLSPMQPDFKPGDPFIYQLLDQSLKSFYIARYLISL